MCNGRHDLDECKAFNDMKVEERSKSLSKQKLCMVAMKSAHQNTQQGTVQEETVRFVWQIIQLVYMDIRSEGRMTVKMIMIQTIVPTSKTFIVNQLELEKFLACA